MIKSSVKPTVVGMRNGYVIHFTCPNCSKENSIVYNMPKAYFKSPGWNLRKMQDAVNGPDPGPELIF